VRILDVDGAYFDDVWVVVGFAFGVSSAVVALAFSLIAHMLTESSRRRISPWPFVLGSVCCGLAFFFVFVSVRADFDAYPIHQEASCGSVINHHDARLTTTNAESVMVSDAMVAICQTAHDKLLHFAKWTGLAALISLGYTAWVTNNAFKTERSA